MAKIPEKIGKYKVIKEIARGGMSAIYKAVHPTLKRFVAIKKLTLRGRSTMVERFKREARIMMDFKNDHIAQVYDHFKEGSFYYIVEEFVDGTSLEELVRRERYLPSEVALLIFRDCCKALKYAHDKNVVHRDIKPGNILISKAGEVKLVDFGIATTQEEDEKSLTRDGMTLGTPSYMSPEQISDTKSVDKRADIYSLGVMLYEMVTGKKPFPGGFTPETISRIQKGRYKPAKKVNPRVSPTANTIIRRSMKPKPKRRFQDLDDVFRILNLTFKKKDPRATQESIRSFVEKKDASAAKKAKTSRLRSLLTVGLIALGAIAAVAVFLYQQGIFYEWFGAKSYGAMVVAAKIAKGYKEPGEITIDAVLNREVDNKNTRLDKVKLNFRENRQKETESTFTLESQRLYLKSDHYRVKVTLENTVLWDALYLEPRELQKANPLTTDGQRVEAVLDIFPPLPLNIRYRVVDETSGADISEDTLFSVYLDSQWVKATPRVLSNLETDNVYRFRFEKPGYYPKLYHLIIKPEQTNLEFQVALVPRPGKLRIHSDTEGIRLLINGSDTVLSGAEKIEVQRVAPTSKEPQEIELLPGRYLVTAEHSRKNVKDTVIEIGSDEVVQLDVSYDRKAKNLELGVRESR